MSFVKYTLFALLILLAACGGKQEDPAQESSGSNVADGNPRMGGTLIRHLESECKSLNWVLTTTVYENYVLRYLYENLLDYDKDMNIVPVLAESYEVSGDRINITVKLKDNLIWDDGTPITSNDVKFTIDKILDPSVPALNKAGWFSKLDHMDLPDEKTIIFVWKEPYAPSIHALTQIAPIPQHIYGKGDFLSNPANRSPVGCGPFRFEEWRTSQMISLVRNEKYHGKKAYLDRIIFKVIEDRAVALNALKAGEIDEMRCNQIQWEEQTNDQDFLSRFNKNYFFVPGYNYLSWNCRSTWFKDKRVRLAMTHLFDRESINDKIYSGYAKLISGPFFINSWAYDKSIKPWPFNPDKAKKLLDEAGWIDSDNDGIRDKDGVKFEFEFLITGGNSVAKQLTQLLQEQCAKVGIQLKIRMLEGATFFDKVENGEFDACAIGWRIDLEPDVFDTFHSSQIPPIGLNHGFYSNPQVDSLLELGRIEFDQDKRAEIYHEVHRLLHEDQPYTFVNTVPEKRPVHKKIKNVVISPDGLFNFYPGANYWYIDEISLASEK
jgi:peptide/nickel transport system substrate-binding protein